MYRARSISWLPRVYSHQLLEPSASWREKSIDVNFVSIPHSVAQVRIVSEVSKLVQLLLIMPATNAQSARSISAVRRRSSMTQEGLNHLMLLHIHKCHSNSLDLIDVDNDFIDGNEHRKNFIGSEFKLTDRD